MFDGGQRGQRSNFDAVAGHIANAAQLANAAQIEHIGRSEQLLLHRGQQVGAAGNNLHLALMFRHQGDGIVERLRDAAVGKWADSPLTSHWRTGIRTLSRWIERMPRRPFASEPQRSSMLAEGHRRRRIDGLRHLNSLQTFLGSQRRQHPLRRERSLTQSDSHSVVDRVRDRRNRRGQRAFARFLRAERALRDRCFRR